MFSPTYCIVGLLAVLAWPSHAQTPSSDAPALAAASSVVYQSPLEDYRRFQPQSPESPDSWREANDTVGRIGGWQAYAAEVWEASQSSDSSETDTNTVNAADADPHQHH